MGVKNLTPTKLWPTVLVAAVNSIQFNCKRKTTQFRMILVWIIIFYFKKNLSNHAFENKRFQTLFKDQLVRSKATCSF